MPIEGFIIRVYCAACEIVVKTRLRRRGFSPALSDQEVPALELVGASPGHGNDNAIRGVPSPAFIAKSRLIPFASRSTGNPADHNSSSIAWLPPECCTSRLFGGFPDNSPHPHIHVRYNEFKVVLKIPGGEVRNDEIDLSPDTLYLRGQKQETIGDEHMAAPAAGFETLTSRQ